MGFYFSVCPLTKPPQNLKNFNSPTDLEMQTAIASKDKGNFFDKAFTLSKTYKVSQISTCLRRCVFSVCEPDNMNPHATNKNSTGPKRVHTQEPDEDNQVPKVSSSSTPRLPTKAAKDAFELAVALLPISLQPFIC